MFFSRKIQDAIKKSEARGFLNGERHAHKLRDNERKKIIEKYDLIIMNKNSEICSLNSRIDSILKKENESVERDRTANTKLILAKEIVLKVQAAMDNMRNAAVVSSADILEIRLDIEKTTAKILN